MKQDDSFLEILDACSDLTPYGVAVRYPNGLTVNDEITESAINKARIIYHFCTGKLPKVASGGNEPVHG
jgi:hypothetical protein